jgi:hypothetical protein
MGKNTFPRTRILVDSQTERSPRPPDGQGSLFLRAEKLFDMLNYYNN